MIKATLRPALAALTLLTSALWCAPDAGASGMRAAYPWAVARPAPAVGDIVTTPLCEGFDLGNSLDASGVAPGRPLWLSRDPLGERGGLNLYGFVGNDPVNSYDYLGLSAKFLEEDGLIYWLRNGKKKDRFLIGALKGDHVQLKIPGQEAYDNQYDKGAVKALINAYEDYGAALDSETLSGLPDEQMLLVIADYLAWGTGGGGFGKHIDGGDIYDRFGRNETLRNMTLETMREVGDDALADRYRSHMEDMEVVAAKWHKQLGFQVGTSLLGSGAVVGYLKYLKWGDNALDAADDAVSFGRLSYENGATPDLDEIYAGQVFARNGISVRFLKERQDMRVADLWAPSYGRVDVFTPREFNSTSMARAIEKKHSQTTSVFVNRLGSDVSLDMMQETARRVWGRPRAKPIQRLLFEHEGGLTIIERPR